MSEQMGAAAQSASKAWWDLLQQQFNQIAAATAATMPAAAGADSPAKAKPADSKAAPEAQASRPAARKPAARSAKAGKKTGPAAG
jgi:hypothetical protein